MHGACLEFVQGSEITGTLGPLSAAGSFGMVYAKGLYFAIVDRLCRGLESILAKSIAGWQLQRRLAVCMDYSFRQVSVAKVVWAKYRGASDFLKRCFAGSC